ncbi:MAG: hypothetical protein JWR67_1752 [Mucilaginibacter sp.]|jgi:hypothetical protein|nr:hypothetical protein [Mucilaginibacter sp.]
MSAADYISQMPAERQDTLTAIHKAISANDPSVIPVVKPMMGKEMILYEERCYMKYALASTKNYMSLHCLPMYMNPSLHAKYASLLPAAKFQKGCINFTDGKDLPIVVLAELIAECSSIDIAAMLENRKRKS